MFAALFSSTKVDFRDGKKGEVLRPRPWESDIRYPYQARKKRSNFRLNRLFFDIPRYIKIRVSAVQERVSRQRFWRCANSGSSKTILFLLALLFGFWRCANSGSSKTGAINKGLQVGFWRCANSGSSKTPRPRIRHRRRFGGVPIRAAPKRPGSERLGRKSARRAVMRPYWVV